MLTDWLTKPRQMLFQSHLESPGAFKEASGAPWKYHSKSPFVPSLSYGYEGGMILWVSENAPLPAAGLNSLQVIIVLFLSLRAVTPTLYEKRQKAFMAFRKPFTSRQLDGLSVQLALFTLGWVLCKAWAWRPFLHRAKQLMRDCKKRKAKCDVFGLPQSFAYLGL